MKVILTNEELQKLVREHFKSMDFKIDGPIWVTDTSGDFSINIDDEAVELHVEDVEEHVEGI